MATAKNKVTRLRTDDLGLLVLGHIAGQDGAGYFGSVESLKVAGRIMHRVVAMGDFGPKSPDFAEMTLDFETFDTAHAKTVFGA